MDETITFQDISIKGIRSQGESFFYQENQLNFYNFVLTQHSELTTQN